MKITNVKKRTIFKLQSIVLTITIILFGSHFTSAQQRDSLDIKIGQMILIGFPRAAVDTKVLQEIREGKVGSIIIFEKNIPAKNSFVELKKIVWTYQQAAQIPLLVSIDQEGGKVNRLKDKYGFPRSITAEAMGKANSLDSVRFYAEATAATLAGLGINVNFAPVVDLAANPSNPVIVRNGRAFSNNEDSVALLAKEFIIQHRKYGVLTSLKHFPGHGSSVADTHLGIADVTQSWNERELHPYEKLISEGYADAVMSAHIVNRNLDKAGRPGTLSADILDGILRKRLRFDGLVFSDDMQMHAITKHYGLEESIKLAINAGIDIMTFSNNISGSEERTVDKVHGIIKRFVASGEISRERIDESFRRIMRVKNKLMSDQDNLDLQRDLDRLQQRTRSLEDEIAGLKKDIETLAAKEVPTEQPDSKKNRRKKKKNR
jgi:beta-N-acetylhexosaminidase